MSIFNFQLEIQDTVREGVHFILTSSSIGLVLPNIEKWLSTLDPSNAQPVKKNCPVFFAH